MEQRFFWEVIFSYLYVYKMLKMCGLRRAVKIISSTAFHRKKGLRQGSKLMKVKILINHIWRSLFYKKTCRSFMLLVTRLCPCHLHLLKQLVSEVNGQWKKQTSILLVEGCWSKIK
jgi:hypothetical protein